MALRGTETLTVNSAGNPVTTTVAEFNSYAGFANIKDFASNVGIGNADADTDAANALLAYIRAQRATDINDIGASVFGFIPPGKYFWDDTINATGIIAVNWGLYCSGAIIESRAAGKPAIDMLSSRYASIYDLSLYGHATDKPTYGIQGGRISTADAGEQFWSNLRVDGWFTKAAFYNYASEVMTFTGPRLRNRDTTSGARCLIIDAKNAYNITSTFVTQTNAEDTARSTLQWNLYGADIRKVTSGSAIELIGNSGAVKFYGSYAVSQDGPIILINEATLIPDLLFDFHFETTGATIGLMIDNAAGVNLPMFTMRAYAPQVTTGLIDTTVNVGVVTFDDADILMSDPNTAGLKIFGSVATATRKLVTGRIGYVTSGNTTADFSTCTFQGDLYTSGSVPVVTYPTAGTWRHLRRPSTTAAMHAEHSGFRVDNRPRTALATDSNQTLTAAQFRTGLIRRSGITADRSDTTPTAALLVADVSGAKVGHRYEVDLANADDTHSWIILAGAGVTLVGTATIPLNKCARAVVQFDVVTASSEAVSIYLTLSA